MNTIDDAALIEALRQQMTQVGRPPGGRGASRPLALVQESAALAEKVTDGAHRSILHTACLRDMGLQLQRERLEDMLMAARP
ncbi:MAG TPA: hypothetical protein VFD69_20150 [Vicinamibacterales bacterium]|nr:hypothetical protein [Vicinamibacterales bacterium]